MNEFGESKGSADKVFQEFLSGTVIQEEEIRKGVPWVSFIYRERDEAVFIHPLSLFHADERIKRQSLMEKEILYRVDYLEKDKKQIASGILPAADKVSGFLERMEKSITAGEKKAGGKEFYLFLKIHFTLCALENHVKKRKALVERANGEIWESEKMYCEELSSYIKTVRENLNDRPENSAFPEFPVSGRMAGKCEKGEFFL